MPTSQYLPFGTAVGANTLAYATYSATSALIGSGYTAGEADAQHINTVLRQATTGVAGVAKFATDWGILNAPDDGNPATFAAALKSAIDELLRLRVPAGKVDAFARATAPAGYLVCDGAAVSRTTYAELFTAVGVLYGAGDGSTTFNLPDYRGMFLRGWDAGRGLDEQPARAFASTQTSANLSHTHALHVFQRSIDGEGDEGDNTVAPFSTGISGYIDSAGGSESRPVNTAVLFCIKT